MQNEDQIEDPTPVEKSIIVGWATLQGACHDASKASGWWTDTTTGENLLEGLSTTRQGKERVGSKINLIHTELSEATEGARKNRADDHLPHRKQIEVELADAIIRIGDLAGALGLDVAGAIVEKMRYNAQRPDHKIENRKLEGGKAF